jgi:hypothetical protein
MTTSEMTLRSLNPELKSRLFAIYEEIMWLASRPGVTASCARAWYTHIMANRMTKDLRRFTGKVSRAALASDGSDLMLEHYLRIQTTLTALVERHKELKTPKPREFLRLMLEYERVHIVTRAENYAALRAKGDYTVAGIRLVEWSVVPSARRAELWQRMLRGRVANASEFEPVRRAV